MMMLNCASKSISIQEATIAQIEKENLIRINRMKSQWLWRWNGPRVFKDSLRHLGEMEYPNRCLVNKMLTARWESNSTSGPI